MNSKEQARFNKLYQQHLTELKLQGLAPKTIDANSRAVRRITEYFDRCPDGLNQAQLKAFFCSLVDSHSWSTVKLDRPGNAPATPAFSQSLASQLVFSSSTAMCCTSNGNG